jgi:hypothetical protein
MGRLFHLTAWNARTSGHAKGSAQGTLGDQRLSDGSYPRPAPRTRAPHADIMRQRLPYAGASAGSIVPAAAVGILCRQDHARCKARRSSSRAADQIRNGDQSQPCQGAWSRRAADPARPRRRGDRATVLFCRAAYVRFWHKADVSRWDSACPLLEAKRTFLSPRHEFCCRLLTQRGHRSGRNPAAQQCPIAASWTALLPRIPYRTGAGVGGRVRGELAVELAEQGDSVARRSSAPGGVGAMHRPAVSS